MADETSSVASTAVMGGEREAGSHDLHRLHGSSPPQDPAQSDVPWEAQDCFKRLARTYSILAQAAQARADRSDPPDLRSHVQHRAQQQCQTRRMRASSVPCKCSWRVRSRSSGMPRRRWRVRACASTHLRRRLGFGENMSSSSQMWVMCSNSWLFRMLIS